MSVSREQWQAELADAESPSDVTVVAWGYVEMLTDEEVAALPPQLRPGPIGDYRDVMAWAFTLRNRELHPSTEEGAESLIAQVTRFFEAASARIVELRARRILPDYYLRDLPDKESE